MTQTVELNTADTIASLLARVRSARAGAGEDATERPRLLFVAPSGLELTSVDLRLLRREAQASGLQLAFVTSDPGLRSRASREGISTFRSSARGERARWRRLPADKPLRPPPGGEADVETPFGSGLYSKRSPSRFQPVEFLRSFVRGPSPWWTTLGMILVLGTLLALLTGAFILLIPSATVTVSPASDETQVRVSLLAIQDAEADPDAGIVPARVLSTQASGEGRTKTTGRSQEAAGKAGGQAMFVNRTNAPVTVPAGAVVSTATGNDARFVTLLDAPLAPGGRAEVPIEAALPGPAGNARVGTITRVEGPLSLSVFVTNNSPTAGGTTAQVAVVSEEDKERLQSELLEKLKEQAYQQLNDKLEPGSYIPPETVTYLALSPSFTPFVGEVSPDLFLNMTVQAVGLVVDTEAGQAAALARLQDAMPPGTRLISDTLRYTPGGVAAKDGQTVSFGILAEGTLLQSLDTSAMRNAILGMTPQEATAELVERFPLAKPPEIHLGPDWLPYIVPTNLPTVPWRIRVITDYDTAAQLAQQEPG